VDKAHLSWEFPSDCLRKPLLAWGGEIRKAPLDIGA
jgi:hypothetical protein